MSTVQPRVSAYARATHLGPTLAVTAIVTLLAASAGQERSNLRWVAAAILAGQLAVGWSNDAYDAERDRRAGRTDKPIVRGDVSRAEISRAAIVAGVASVPLSYAAGGPIGGSAHVLAVASALSYNLLFKTTPFSGLPWMISFGSLPFFVTYGLELPRPPTAWVVAVAAMLGLGAHLVNAARDVDSDREVSAGGLGTRLGERRARGLGAAVFTTATIVLVLNLDVSTVIRVAAVVIVVLAATTGAAVSGGRRMFEVLVVLALLDTVLLLLAAGSIAS